MQSALLDPRLQAEFEDGALLATLLGKVNRIKSVQ